MTIELVQEEDAEALAAIYRPYVEKTAITFEYQAPSAEEFKARIRHTLERYPYLKAVEDGKILGYCYAGPFKGREAYDWSVETSIYVAAASHRKGVGRQLYQALEEKLKRQGVVNVNACIAYPVTEDPYLTRDSYYFHSRMGYQLAGRFHQCAYKFDRWYDMIWMEKFIGDHTDHPMPFIPYSDLTEDTEGRL